MRGLEFTGLGFRAAGRRGLSLGPRSRLDVFGLCDVIPAKMPAGHIRSSKKPVNMEDLYCRGV